MAKKKPAKKAINLNDLAADAGLTVMRDSEYALIQDRLPLFLPRIDKQFGGGFPFGRMVEIAGKPGGGKSVLTQHAARVAVELGCIVVLIDVEGTADRIRLANLGIDINRLLVKQPDPDQGVELTVEEIGRTIETAIDTFSVNYPGVPLVFIWDSVGQTPSEVELSKDFGDQNVGARAKAITQFTTKIAPKISQTKSLLLAINQIRDDIGGNPMFATVKVPGGKAWEHYASLRLEIKKKQAIKKGQDKIGHIMGVKVNKSKISRPHTEEDAFLISDTGLDYEYNITEMAKEAKILEAPGASFQYVDVNGEIHKMKRDNFVEWLRTDEGQHVREELLNKLVELEFPEGYTALTNENLDITTWLDTVHNVGLTPATSLPEIDSAADVAANDLVQQVEDEIKGEKA